MSRPELSTLEGAGFDVIVIGAGINGASSAQHLAAAGYAVLLVDKGDFASGSTSRSTRLLHCGLRYFETKRPLVDFALAPGKLAVALRMARASMRMRSELVRDQPGRHLAFTMLFPIHRSGPYRGWQLDIAGRLLERFGGPEVPLDYRRSGAAAAAGLPLVRDMADPDGLRSVGMFTEYRYDWPERICLDAVLDAGRMGAVVRNYTHAALVGRGDDGRWAVTLTDGEQAVTVHAPVVLNMAGIWIDRVNAGAGQGRRLIFGTKGAHVVVKLPPDYADYGMSIINGVGEPHYIVPSQGGYHHIGPTETAYEGDIDDIRADRADIDFLLDQTAALLPGLGIGREDVVSTWAGVRPLGFDPAYPKGRRSADLHDLSDQGAPGLYALTAGPIMTHRFAAREVVETVSRVIAPSRAPQPPDFGARASPEHTNAPALVDGDFSVRLSDLTRAVTEEQARSLRDVLFTRTGAAYKHHLTDHQLRRATETVAGPMGWDGAEVDRQIAAFNDEVQRIYGIA